MSSQPFVDLTREADEAARVARQEVYARHREAIDEEIDGIVTELRSLAGRAASAVELLDQLANGAHPARPVIEALAALPDGAPSAPSKPSGPPTLVPVPTGPPEAVSEPARPLPEPPAPEPSEVEAEEEPEEPTPLRQAGDDDLAAIRRLEGELTPVGVGNAIGVSDFVAAEALRLLATRGEVFIAGFPKRGRQVAYTFDRDQSLAAMPQGSKDWTQMPAAQTDRDSSMQEAAARGQSLLLWVVERGGTWVAREVFEEVERWGLSLERVSSWLRDLSAVSPPVVKRTGHMRRSAQQAGAGRTAVEYAAPGYDGPLGAGPRGGLAAAPAPAEVPAPAKTTAPKDKLGKASLSDGMAFVREHAPLTVQELSEHFEMSLRWGGEVMRMMHRPGTVYRRDDGRWDLTVKQAEKIVDTDEPEPEPEPEEAPALPGEAPARLAMVALRTWVTDQEVGDAFPVSRAQAATGESYNDTLALLHELEKTGELLDVSAAPDVPLFSRAEDPGLVARREMRKRIREADEPTKRGEPVAGTGRGLVLTDPDQRQLVQDAVAKGASVGNSLEDNGHINVHIPGRKRPVQISGTPKTYGRTKARDRIRVRKAFAEVGIAF